MSTLLRIAVLCLVLLAPAGLSRAAAAELIMFDREGCHWCAEWDRLIGSEGYAASPQGKRAPLRRLSIFERMPDDLANISGTRYTPTFVLVDKGREIGRIPGYPGVPGFWRRLDELLAKLDQQS